MPLIEIYLDIYIMRRNPPPNPLTLRSFILDRGHPLADNCRTLNTQLSEWGCTFHSLDQIFAPKDKTLNTIDNGQNSTMTIKHKSSHDVDYLERANGAILVTTSDRIATIDEHEPRFPILVHTDRFEVRNLVLEIKRRLKAEEDFLPRHIEKLAELSRTYLNITKKTPVFIATDMLCWNTLADLGSHREFSGQYDLIYANVSDIQESLPYLENSVIILTQNDPDKTYCDRGNNVISIQVSSLICTPDELFKSQSDAIAGGIISFLFGQKPKAGEFNSLEINHNLPKDRRRAKEGSPTQLSNGINLQKITL